MPSFFYPDYDAGGFKEMDVLASRTIVKAVKTVPKFPYQISIGLVIQCKKRDGYSWVFFPRIRQDDDVYYSGVGLSAVDSFKVTRLSSLAYLTLQLTTPASYRQFGFGLAPRAFLPSEVAKGIWGLDEELKMAEARDFRCLSSKEKALFYDVVRLKKNEKDSRDQEYKQIHDALEGLAKATEDRLVKHAQILQGNLDVGLYLGEPTYEFWFFFPVLILDGSLKVWRKGTQPVSDSSQVLCQVPLRSVNYFYDRLLSVVTRERFSDWLVELEQDAQLLATKIMNQRTKLDSQTALLERYASRPPGLGGSVVSPTR